MNLMLFGTDVRFEDPWAFALVTIVLVALALDLRRASAPGGGLLFSSLGLIPGARSGWRARLRWTLVPLRFAAALLLVLALARPLVAHAAVAEGIDIGLVLDISSSMGARDFGGQARIDAAKKVMKAFVSGLHDDRVALVVFQAEAIELSPLTLDYGATQRLIDPLEAGGLRLRGGTAIGLGIAQGVDLLRDSAARSKMLIVLTDGENNAGDVSPIDAAQIAKVLGVRVYTIGAVPTNVAEKSIEVDEKEMQRVSELTGGQYHRASDETTLLSIYRDIAALEKSRVGTRAFTDYEEAHRSFLIPGAALLLLEALLAATVLRRVP